MPPQGGTVTLARADLEAMLERASEAGAKKALAAVGLHDEDAATDVHELRSLLDSFRDVRREAWRSVVKALTTVLLIAIALGGFALLQRGGGDLPFRY
jgi:hypothetical protein